MKLSNAAESALGAFRGFHPHQRAATVRGISTAPCRGSHRGTLEEFASIERARSEPGFWGSAPWSCLPYRASAGSSTPAFNVLREARERLAPSHPLPRLLRRCAGPRDDTFLATFSSRSSSTPHTPHRWIRFDSALGIFVSQREQSCDLPAGETSTNGMPAVWALPFRMSRSSRQPCSAIARFSPRFPGLAIFPVERHLYLPGTPCLRRRLMERLVNFDRNCGLGGYGCQTK